MPETTTPVDATARPPTQAAQGPDPRALWPALQSARRERRDRLLAPVAEVAGRPAAPRHLTWVGDLQQGDGGKGAMTDRLAAFHHITARVQGGDNAGHTTVFQDGRGDTRVLKSHLLPSGLRHPGVFGVIANGVLVNAETLAHEVAGFRAGLPPLRGRLLLSDRAHLVLPLHREADGRQEEERGSAHAIGTTRRGIGPANVSKANRIGIRVGDLRDPRLLRRRVEQNVRFFGLPRERTDEQVAWLGHHRDLLLSLAGDSVLLLRAAADAGYSIVLEGAQGPMLDIEHGVYPYVTTSPTAFYSVAGGTGLDAAAVDHRIGVLKAYQTMVGNGPFVTEDHGALGDRLREAGDEFGTTTSRPRRCGWLDLVHARWAVELNGYSSVVVTKLDVLDGFDRIGLCVSYEPAAGGHGEFRPDHAYLGGCAPVYCWLPGWRTPTKGVRRQADLPVEARGFLRYVADYLGVEVTAAGVGPAEQDIVVTPGGELARLMAPAAPGPATQPAAGGSVPGPRRVAAP
ncbi:adenylosuccinate synthetase [Streptomyces sp. NPDC050560]|uniref:adenylosuccinate synthetase n=1 Tax=Streptomyces sp. NPDC050560 TaxID=3365630 RepID=UPI0037B81E0E